MNHDAPQMGATQICTGGLQTLSPISQETEISEDYYRSQQWFQRVALQGGPALTEEEQKHSK